MTAIRFFIFEKHWKQQTTLSNKISSIDRIISIPNVVANNKSRMISHIITDQILCLSSLYKDLKMILDFD